MLIDNMERYDEKNMSLDDNGTYSLTPKKTFQCLPSNLLAIMIRFLGRDSEAVNQYLENNCSVESNSTSPIWSWELSASHKEDLHLLYAAQNFYAYLTPIIIGIGIVGNILSIKVFTCRRMRKVSASFYLTALAASDILVLLTYVLVDWMSRGMHLWPGHRSFDLLIIPGMCQLMLFLSYVFRFISAWLIVIFTVERFIGVCKPLHRRALCTDAFAKRAVIAIALIGASISSYKPALTGIRRHDNITVCTHRPDYVMVNFVLDGIYACVITALPFIIIAVLNCLIIKKLNDAKRRHRRTKFSVDESSIKLEFTAILLIISTTFIVLNLPYFVLWCMNFRRQMANPLTLSNPTQAERMRGWMYIAKTIFFGNYCVNFFLYSMTGTYFRRQLMGFVCQDMICAPPYYVTAMTNTSQNAGHQMSLRAATTSGLQTEILHVVKSHKTTDLTITCNSRRTSWMDNYN